MVCFAFHWLVRENETLSALLFRTRLYRRCFPNKCTAQAEDTYFQANNWASYDDWRRARDQWDYFCKFLSSIAFPSNFAFLFPELNTFLSSCPFVIVGMRLLPHAQRLSCLFLCLFPR